MTDLKIQKTISLILFTLSVLFALACGTTGGAPDAELSTTQQSTIEYKLNFSINDTTLSKARFKTTSWTSVSIILEDGSQTALTQNSAGEYVATLNSINFDPTADSFVVIAKKGELELRKLWLGGDDMSSTIAVNTETTAFALLAQETVRLQSNEEVNSESSNLSLLLNVIKTRDLKTSIQSLKLAFASNDNNVYTEIKNSIRNLVDSANKNADTNKSLLEQFENNTYLISNQSFALLFTAPIQNNTIRLGTNNFNTTFTLKSGGFNQYLLPVKIGSQTLNLLIDTGSSVLIVFDKKILDNNPGVIRTTTNVSKKYASGIRSGVLAKAEVQIGGYKAKAMDIMLIQSPGPDTDPSLTAKKADGIIGLRKTAGLSQSLDSVVLSIPLSALEPAISSFELNLPPVGSGSGTLSFGRMPVLDKADSGFVFRAKTHSIASDVIGQEFADLQVPFRAKSSYGKVDDTTFERKLDVLLDTGAVSKLVLDVKIAETLGYDSVTKKWKIPATELIEFNIAGPDGSLALLPKFKVSDIHIANYISSSVSFEAVLGIESWQNYVVGFHFVDFQSGASTGDGTMSFIQRKDLEYALTKSDHHDVVDQRFVKLPGLNSNGDDGFASIDNEGKTIAFQSNRNSGKGNWDIYVYQLNTGILDLPQLNSDKEDSDPSISGDGRYVVFHSNRSDSTGDYDIYMYDISTKQFINLPGLNTVYRERTPAISPDGRYIVFRSERPNVRSGLRDDNSTNKYSDIYLYDTKVNAILPTPALRSSSALNQDGYDYDPSISENGAYISFDSDGSGVDIFLYNVATDQLETLPTGTNSSADELASAISHDGKLIAFQSNRNEPHMGKFNQDIFLYDRTGAVQLFQQGLNTAFNEIGPQFNGNGSLLVFHSNRPGGEGSTDVYVYRIKTTSVPSLASSINSKETLELNRTVDGVLTVAANVNNNEHRFLIDTSLDGLLVFDDTISLNDLGSEFPYQTYRGNIQVSTSASSFSIGHLKAENILTLSTKRESYQALKKFDLTGIAGVIGLSKERTAQNTNYLQLSGIVLQSLTPVNQMMEFNFNPYGKAYLTLGQMPEVSQSDPYFLFNTHVEGNTLMSGNTQELSYSDLQLPSVFVYNTTQAGLVSEKSVLISTNEVDTLIISKELALELGGDIDPSKWGSLNNQQNSNTVSIYIKGIKSYLRIPSSYSSNKVVVIDFKSLGYHYDAVLSLDRWNDFIVGFDTYHKDAGGPEGVASFLHRGDIVKGKSLSPVSDKVGRYLKLSQLNSKADDAYGCISADGKVIAFQSNRTGGIGQNDIYVYNLGTKTFTTLTGLNSIYEDKRPSLNETGTELVFQSNRDGVASGRKDDYDIYHYNLSTQLLTKYSFNTELSEEQAQLSPDSSYMVYTTTDRGFQTINFYSKTDIANPWNNVYSVNVNNHKTAAEFSLSFNSSGINEYNPAISGLIKFPRALSNQANGSDQTGYLVALSLKHQESTVLGEDIALYRYIPGSDSDNGLIHLELPLNVNLNTAFLEGSPSISPDGNFLSYYSNRKSPGAFSSGKNLKLLALNSGEFIFLPGINSLSEDSHPSMSNNAAKILFHSKRHDSQGGYDLYIYVRDL